jgi:sigma-B regulation protein RsbU (phosphoserine phosphatase)
MRKRADVNTGGLRKKLFLLCLMLIITACVAFGVIGIIQVRRLTRVVTEKSTAQNEAIKQRTQESTENLTFQNMLNTIILSADNVDGEFRTMKHDFSILAEQVKDVFEHPEQYTEREVYAPDPSNAGKYALQLVFSGEEAEQDEETMKMARKLANLEPLMAEIVRGNHNYTRDCYIALVNGTTLEMDTFSDRKLDENGVVNRYDAKTRPWYQAAVKNGAFCFTLAVHSYYMGAAQLQYGYPIYHNGKLVAVLQGSTSLTVIQEIISDVGIGEKGFSILVSDDGKLVFSPRESGELAMKDGVSEDIRETNNEGLEALVKDAFTREIGIGETAIDGETYYAAYARMPTVNWSLITFVPKSEIDRPTEELLKEVDEISERSDKELQRSFRDSSWIVVGILVLLIINASVAAVSLSGRITKPIQVMTKQIEDTTGEQFTFRMEDVYKTGDEIEVLANTFGHLSNQMADYLRNILSMTAEKERVSTELSIATNIQADMLPNEFPAFPDRTEFDLYASMNPAKEVGGDFYDFFMIDDDHLGLVIADVSDKGVPAALFMMSAKIIINYRAKMGGSPGEIITDANKELSRNNKLRMFVTLWMGILEISTGKLTCTNAGHEYPLIRGQDGVFRMLKDKHGIAVGTLPKIKYKDYDITLEPGDAIFVYTDGVPEANNTDGEMFSMKRIEETLNRHAKESPRGILEGVKADLDEFVNGAEQFDDLTMLCLEYHGKPKEITGTDGR